MYLKEMMALLSIKGIGMQTLKKLIDFYGDMEVLSKALEENKVFSQTKVKGTDNIKEIFDAFDYQSYDLCLKKENVSCISYLDENYPKMLKNIDTFPLMLHYKGTISKLNQMSPGIAVVGSRKISAYGQQVAYDIGRYLGAYELPVISGLAYGVDYEVHRGLVKGGGFPVAVVANGLDRIYPSSHSKLAGHIEKTGILITEEFLYSGIEAYKFPIRNRIISGLADVIVVVEAEEKSGSLITAQHGLDQGKTVFAVPGSIYSSTSKGTNKLIADGAIPLLDFKQLIDEYDFLIEKSEPDTKILDDPNRDLIEQKIINCLSDGNTLSIDELAFMSKEDHTKILMAGMKLEIQGVIRSVKGNKYQLL